MSRVPVPVAEVVEAELGDEVALLLPENGETLLLNPTAAEVWAQCDGQQDVETIARILHEAFPAADELALQVTATVDDLVGRGFLCWRAEPVEVRETAPPTPTAP